MTSTLSVPLAPVRPRRAARAMAGRLAGPLLGAGAAAALGIGVGTPSYWGDEAASVISAERPWGSLLRELSRIDAVHGLYYAFLHVWIQLFGATETATRIPSLIAAGFAVWGAVTLGRSLFGLRVGIIAGGVLAIIPEFTRVAIEARSYAGAAALGVWLTVLLVRIAVRPGRRVWWALYTVGAIVAVVLLEWLALLVVAHLALLWALRAPRATWRRWLTALAVAAVPVAAFGVLSLMESAQIAFLANHDYGSLWDVFVAQWFRKIPLAVLCWALIVAGVVLGLRRIRSQRRRVIAVAIWGLGPTALIASVNALIVPVYNERYLSPTLPAVALVIALGIDGLIGLARTGRIRALVAVGLAAALLACAVPPIAAQRTPYAKDGGADLRQAAAELHRLAQPGDAVIFTETVRPSERPRLETHLYPADFTGLDDVALVTPAADRAALWDTVLPVDQLGPRLADHPVVWASEVRGFARADLDALEALGYRVTDRVPVHRTVLYRLEKETP